MCSSDLKIIQVGRLSYLSADADDLSDEDDSTSAASSEEDEQKVMIEQWVDWI